MCDSIAQLSQAISTNKGDIVSKFFDLGYLRKLGDNCNQLIKESYKTKFPPGPSWKDIIYNLLKIPNAQSEKEGFACYEKAKHSLIPHFLKMENNLKIPILKAMARTIKEFSKYPGIDGISSLRHLLKPATEVVEEPYSEFGCALISVVTNLVMLFLEMNNYEQAFKALKIKIDDINERATRNTCTQGELAQFWFISGKIYTVVGSTYQAIDYLTKALNLLPTTQHPYNSSESLEYKQTNAWRNRRLVYSVLIPNQISIGLLPTKEILEFYNLEIYSNICAAITDMDYLLFDSDYEKNSITFIRLGVWDIIGRCRSFIDRRVTKVVCQQLLSGDGDSKVRALLYLKPLCSAMAMTQPNITAEDTESAVSELISRELLSAYISDLAQIAVLNKKNMFPPLPLKE